MDDKKLLALKPEPDPAIGRLLRHLADQADAGGIRGVAIAADHGNEIGTAWCGAGSQLQLLAAIATLHHRFAHTVAFPEEVPT